MTSYLLVLVRDTGRGPHLTLYEDQAPTATKAIGVALQREEKMGSVVHDWAVFGASAACLRRKSDNGK